MFFLKWPLWVLQYMICSLKDKVHKFFYIKRIVGKLWMLPQSWVVALILRKDFVLPSPSDVVDTSQPSQVQVTTFISTVVQFKHRSPVWKEKQMGKTSSMHSNKYVCVMRDSQLI